MAREVLGATSYQQFARELPIAVYACDTAGRITFFNEAAIEIWGQKPMEGDLWWGGVKATLTDGSALTVDSCPIALLLQGRPAINSEIVIERNDGARRFVLPYPKLLTNEEGNVTGAVNILIDITDRKEKDALVEERELRLAVLKQELEKNADERNEALRAQNEALKKSEERYHKMVEEVRDYAILLLDRDGTVLNWNKGAEQIKGYSEKEIVGRNFRMFYLPEDQEIDLPGILINEAAVNGKAMNEGLRVRKDGTTFWGSITITALHDDDNNVIGFSKVTRDLTAKKAADDKLKEYTKELERQNKELGRYAYIASHDLQEPLRKIQTFSSIANTTDDKDKLKGYLDKINASALRMSALIKGMLNYAKIANAEKDFITTDLNGIFKNILEDFELVISEKNVLINCGALPSVKAVSVEMYQLFSNLLSNAIKFCDKQPVIKIEAVALPESEVRKHPELNQDSAYAEITISDNGIGFDPKFANEVFDLFKRLNNSKAYTGTGLGLAVCKKIVEGHKGVIYASSEPDKGTVFTIILPVI